MTETHNFKEIMSVKEVSEYLGISLSGAYDLFHAKDFPTFKPNGKNGRALRVRKSKLDEFIERRESEYENF